MKTREELIKQCRYYKGEEECPENIKRAFWYYEKAWVEFTIKNKQYINSMTQEYLARHIDLRDTTPLGIKALLYNRFAHWNVYYTNNDFIQWYKKEYIMEY